MANDESPAAGSSRGSADGRPSDDTLVAQPTNQAGPLPKKQGELGWTPPADDAAADQTTAETGLPGPHPAERAPSPNPSPNPTPDANASSTSLGSQSQCSIFKQFLRKPRALPKINGIRSATIFRVSLLSLTLIATIIGWVITATRMNAWNAHANSAPVVPVDHPSPDGANSTAPPAAPSQQQVSQMADSSLAFAHVAFGAAVLFQLLMLERAVYRLRAERYAFLHPDEVLAASTGGASGIMGLAPWNRPPLPTYAAALGVRGTGDVEDAIIAAPPPPEYGNTRGSTLLLSAAILNRSASSSSSSQRNPASGSRPPSQGTVRDALGRPMGEWSRPVSYGEDELRQDARRSLDLEAALSRLEGQETREVGDGWVHVTRPENAALRA